MSDDLAEVIAAHPVLAGLPADALALVAGCAHNVAVPEGQRLLTEGDAADRFYLLRRGRVALEIHAPGRGPLVIETVEPGHIVGWSWLFPPYRVRFDARAVEAVGAVAIDAGCLRAKAESDPAFGYELLKRFTPVVIDRLQATRLRLLDLYGDAHAR